MIIILPQPPTLDRSRRRAADGRGRGGVVVVDAVKDLFGGELLRRPAPQALDDQGCMVSTELSLSCIGPGISEQDPGDALWGKREE